MTRSPLALPVKAVIVPSPSDLKIFAVPMLPTSHGFDPRWHQGATLSRYRACSFYLLMGACVRLPSETNCSVMRTTPQSRPKKPPALPGVPVSAAERAVFHADCSFQPALVTNSMQVRSSVRSLETIYNREQYKRGLFCRCQPHADCSWLSEAHVRDFWSVCH